VFNCGALIDTSCDSDDRSFATAVSVPDDDVPTRLNDDQHHNVIRLKQSKVKNKELYSC